MIRSELSETILDANLKALSQRNPSLARRICEPMEGNHLSLFKAASGDLTARLESHGGIFLHSAADPVAEGSSIATGLVWEADRSLLCLGVGLGYYLPFLLEKCNSHQTIFAYERDPWLLRLTLMLTDFCRDILAWRLQFLLGTDLSTIELEDISTLWKHPVLGSIYNEELTFLKGSAPSNPRERAMVVAGGLFVNDVVEALGEEQFQTLVWDPRRVSRQESLHQVRQFAPGVIFAINYCHGLPELCESLGIPLVIWEIDPSIERLPQNSHCFPHCFIYTYRKAHWSRFREAGFQNVEYLPLGTNPKRRRPMNLSRDDQRKYGADVAFAGSSMVEQSQELLKVLTDITTERGFKADPGTVWEKILNLQTCFSGEGAVEQMFQKCLESGDEASRVLPDSRGHLVDLASCVGEAASSRRRLGIVSELAAGGFDVAAWGDSGWETTVPSGVRYCGPAGHNYELTRIYNAAKIHLDINRTYQNDIVTMRVFDIPACKGFVLADASSDLAELFQPDSEVIAYRSTDELKSLVEHFLCNEEDRRQVAVAGYERVLKDHTILQRMRSILQNLP